MKTSSLSLVALLLLAGCGDVTTPGDASLPDGAMLGDAGPSTCEESRTYGYPGCGVCRSDMECEAIPLDVPISLACFVRGAARQPLPGIPPQCLEIRACESAADCGADQACAEYGDPDCFVRDSECRPSCTVTGCADGNRCNADGLCELIPCDETGGSCDSNWHCEGSSCVQNTCTMDDDCGIGRYCVRGVCESMLGNCLAIARP